MARRSPAARTLANAACIEGFFAIVWFSWADPQPLGWASILPSIGAVLALLVGVGGIVMARRARQAPSTHSRERHGLVIVIELAAIGAGSALLAATGHGDFIAAWVSLVVGAHFLALDRIFPGIGMVPLAAAVVCTAAAAFVIGATTSIPPSTVAGLGTGGCLLGHAASLLVIAAG